MGMYIVLAAGINGATTENDEKTIEAAIKEIDLYPIKLPNAWLVGSDLTFREVNRHISKTLGDEYMTFTAEPKDAAWFQIDGKDGFEPSFAQIKFKQKQYENK